MQNLTKELQKFSKFRTGGRHWTTAYNITNKVFNLAYVEEQLEKASDVTLFTVSEDIGYQWVKSYEVLIYRP